MRIWKRSLGIAITTMSLALIGCSHSPKHHMAKGRSMQTAPMMATSAIAVLHPTAGHNVSGIVRFTQTGTAVRVVADLEGLAPNTVHGFHIHEFGDCSAADAMTAGGHFNPEGHPHAGPMAAMRHAGDLGNITSNADGTAHLEITLEGLTISGPTNAIVGRSVIIHDKPDDLVSQPVGNAGPRAACGVIGMAKGL